MRVKTNRFISRTILGAVSLLKETVSNEEMASRHGFLQGCDPRLKCLNVAVMLGCALWTGSAWFLLAIWGGCLVFAMVSKISPLYYLKRTIIFVPIFSFFIIFPAIFHFVTPGRAVASLELFGHTVSITRQGLDSAAIVFLRVLTSVSLSVLLVLTTPHQSLLKALRIFGVPQIFVMTIGMSYRYIFLLLEIVQNSFVAVKSRVGFVSSPGTGRHIVAAGISGLWLRTYRMQSQVYAAMLSRGYGGEPRILEEFHARPLDFILVAAAGITLIGTIWPILFSR